MSREPDRNPTGRTGQGQSNQRPRQESTTTGHPQQPPGHQYQQPPRQHPQQQQSAGYQYQQPYGPPGPPQQPQYQQQTQAMGAGPATGAGTAQQGPPPRGQPSRGGQAPGVAIPIEDVVQTSVVTADPDTPLPTIAASLAEHNVGTVVIVREDAPVGIVTDRMLALALERTPNVTESVARDVMTEDLVTVTEDATVFDVLRTLSSEGIRRVPVVDDQGTLRGIVSLDDILYLIANEFSNVAEVLSKQSPRF